MKKNVVVALLTLLLAASFNTVHAADRDAQAKELMNALGLDALLQGARQQSAKMAGDQMDSMLKRIRQSNPAIDDEAMKELKAAAQQYVERINTSWNTQEAAKIYAAALVEGLPEQEMKAATEHYRTAEGQRELKVIAVAQQSMANYIAQSMQKETEAAAQTFLTEVRAISERGRSRHKSAAQK